MYKHGDIVKPISIDANFEYHIVTDVEEYRNPATKKISSRYQIMQMYPVKKLSKLSFYDNMDLFLVSEAGTHKSTHIMEMIRKERIIKGFEGKADYFRAIEESIHRKDSTFTPFVDESVARYDLIRSIDEGVDALWDLNNFYLVFGDDSYLQLKEIVLKRMDEIVQENKQKSKGKIHK